MPTRNTRSRSRQELEDKVPETALSSSRPRSILGDSTKRSNVEAVTVPLTRKLTSLSVDELELLQLKQRRLQDPDGQIPTFIESLHRGRGVDAPAASTLLADAIAATLVFAQQEAGTAVCISPDGVLLTCSHCIAETHEDLERKEDKWLLFASGCAVRARCVAWDSKRDLALLQIIAAQASPYTKNSQATFPFATVGSAQGGQLICIGHPGSEDLEASMSGVETNYDVLHVSHGRFRGLAKDQDPQDNSEIGALMHDCWTYWGHSGAPLIGRSSGKLVGLHSSWDDSTGVRRGIALVAIRAFLEEYTVTQV